MASKDELAQFEAQVASGDPVHEHDGHWWFWNEVWCDRMGPFRSEIEARNAVRTYAREMLGWDPAADTAATLRQMDGASGP